MFKQARYDVLYLNPDAESVVRTVTVTGGDRLRAELEGKRNSVDITMTQNMAVVQAWAALVREGHYADDYAVFRHRDYIDVINHLDANGEPEVIEVGPTRQTDTSPSVWGSQPSTETPLSGSTTPA